MIIRRRLSSYNESEEIKLREKIPKPMHISVSYCIKCLKNVPNIARNSCFNVKRSLCIDLKKRVKQGKSSRSVLYLFMLSLYSLAISAIDFVIFKNFCYLVPLFLALICMTERKEPFASSLKLTVATISGALQNNSAISEQTKESIFEVAEQPGLIL
jgi:hypothetical protein